MPVVQIKIMQKSAPGCGHGITPVLFCHSVGQIGHNNAVFMAGYAAVMRKIPESLIYRVKNYLTQGIMTDKVMYIAQ